MIEFYQLAGFEKGGIRMRHKIAEAIIENGKIKYINKNLPRGRIKAHLIYDSDEDIHPDIEVSRILKDTSGLYKDINVEKEARKLRKNWERNEKN